MNEAQRDPPTPKSTDTDETVHHEHGAPIEHRSVGPAALNRAAGLFRAAGDASRLRILELLLHGESCVSELAVTLGDELSAVSQRLRVLRAESLVTRRRDGKHIHYRLADEHVAALLRAVLEHACEPHSHDPTNEELRP